MMTAEAVMAPANSSHGDVHPNLFQEVNDNDYYETVAHSEKKTHLEYLKNFRVHQCPLFLQHKCTQHRPFTCFHWHFQNQRRRQPIQKLDKSFNYSPDIYCNQYDETTGTCKKGDECSFLHRVTGDTERRYHLRYYKTSACIHETDDNRNCEKNGPHCAFGHGHDDLRAPIFDASCGTDSAAAEIHERLNPDDNKWNDAEFVLNFYKTEACKKQPRFCRQGYACPHYHNAKDRRRNPKKYKYRSTPCPTVKKVGEDWQDPQKCDKGDNCPMCHTRTEQQFHPDIYKSTKCHDMQQTTYCPRGPFCAFAHVEQQEHDQNPEGIRNRASSDARFELARERRRQQLEARQNNLRNSVSGGEIRVRTNSFNSFRSQEKNWDRNNSNGREPWSNQGTPTSPIIQNSSSPKNFESPSLAVPKIRPNQWPPHPDRDSEEFELWSPDIFKEIETGPELHEEDHKWPGVKSDVPSILSEEISRRRTQSASYTAQHSPPVLKEHDWLTPKLKKSSPITISKDNYNLGTPTGSFGSAIINGVFNNGGNGSGSNSWSEERSHHEMNIMKQRMREMELNYFQAKQQLEFRKQEICQLKDQLHELKLREQQYIRQIDDHSNQLRQDRARERVILEIRTCFSNRTKCLVPRETIQQLQNQLRQDLELLERSAQS